MFYVYLQYYKSIRPEHLMQAVLVDVTKYVDELEAGRQHVEVGIIPNNNNKAPCSLIRTLIWKILGPKLVYRCYLHWAI